MSASTDAPATAAGGPPPGKQALEAKRRDRRMVWVEKGALLSASTGVGWKRNLTPQKSGGRKKITPKRLGSENSKPSAGPFYPGSAPLPPLRFLSFGSRAGVPIPGAAPTFGRGWWAARPGGDRRKAGGGQRRGSVDLNGADSGCGVLVGGGSGTLKHHPPSRGKLFGGPSLRGASPPRCGGVWERWLGRRARGRCFLPLLCRQVPPDSYSGWPVVGLFPPLRKGGEGFFCGPLDASGS